MGGVSIRTLNVFKQLCGSNSLKNVTIVTTRWSKEISVEEQKREQELREDERFFKPFLDHHATMRRHDNTAESARMIIRETCSKQPLPLGIQLEIVEQRRSIGDTHAGKELNGALEELARGLSNEARNLREEIDEAVRQGDGSARAELANVLRRSEGELTRVQNEVKNLQASKVGGIDVEREWRQMSQAVRIATLFRRSQGATESPAVDKFWFALGDTIKIVKEVRTIFDEHPMPLSLRRQLLENVPASSPDLEKWVQRNREAVIQMEELVETALRATQRKRRPRNVWKRLTLFLRFTMPTQRG
jgi:hypothetical protein